MTCLTFFDRDACIAAGDEGGKVLLHRVVDAEAEEVIDVCLVGCLVICFVGCYLFVGGL